MSRIITIVVVVTLIFMIQVAQMAAIEIMDPTRKHVIENGANDQTDLYDKEAIADQIYTVIVQWVPLLAQIGVLLWGAARVFLQSRTTAARGI